MVSWEFIKGQTVAIIQEHGKGFLCCGKICHFPSTTIWIRFVATFCDEGHVLSRLSGVSNGDVGLCGPYGPV
jgi:hypothetical protein